MALTWDVRDIVNHHDVTTEPKIRDDDSDRWHSVTEALVWYSMICGFNKITADNIDEVFERICMWEVAHGPMLANDEGDIRLSRVDLKRHVGLHTNASTLKKAEFEKKVLAELRKTSRPASNMLPAHVVIEDRIARARAQASKEI